MKVINQFKEVIALWDTAADFGRDIDVDEGTARAMKRRNSIASRYWAKTVDAAHEKGLTFITYEALASIASKHKPKPKVKTKPNK